MSITFYKTQKPWEHKNSNKSLSLQIPVDLFCVCVCVCDKSRISKFLCVFDKPCNLQVPVDLLCVCARVGMHACVRTCLQVQADGWAGGRRACFKHHCLDRRGKF